MMEVAIVSTNRNKYSETFIHNHLNGLPFKIHYLFDGYLPVKYSIDKGITEHKLSAKSNFFGKLFYNRKEIKTEQHAQAIEKYLKENKIQVVLCEYGPSGVELMSICRKLDLPLIVHFHGYDAYRNDILSSFGKRYPELFEIASAVVVVSDDMQQQLLKLGCPGNKLHLLPYGVNTNYFKRNQEVKKEFDFVFCGRFVEKKSPLQIIKCFENVVKHDRTVKLVMIGDGELLNASKQLSHQLELSSNIIFTGALTPDKVLEMYQKSKIFINHSVKTSSNDSEGTLVSILEAMACGLVIIASKHAGIKGVIENERNGFLINEGAWEDFTDKLIKTLLNYVSYIPMTEIAINSIVNNYNLEDYLAKLTGLINSVVTKQKIS